MLPDVPILNKTITDVTYPTRTYQIVFSKDINKQNYLTTYNDNLTIDSAVGSSGFVISDDGVVSISYNARSCGYELSQTESGILALTLSSNIKDLDRISGYCDDLKAVIQAVYLILSTERYKYIIYSWDYGIELVDLYGKPVPYVIAELPRRITEALTMDDRIDDVVDFEFEKNGKRLRVKFTVISNVGNITTEMEVAI